MIPTIKEIRDQILADIQSELSLSAPLPPRSVWGVLAAAVAGSIALVYRFTAWTRRQIFTSTADREALLLRGREFGLNPKPATAWRGEAAATGVDGSVLGQGVLLQIGAAVYRARDAVEIAGVTPLSVEALESGSHRNLEPGALLELVSPIAGIDRQVAVTSTTITGEDAEETEDFRKRLLQFQRTRPQGGSAADYVFWATSVPGIIRAFAYRDAPGSIVVYPVVEGSAGDRIPDSAKLTEVENYLSDTSRRPLAAAVSTAAPTVVEFDIAITSANPNTPSLRQLAEERFHSYIDSRYPKQYADEVNPTDLITSSEIYRALFEVGITQADLTLTRVGSGTTVGYQLGEGELAEIRNITWP